MKISNVLTLQVQSFPARIYLKKRNIRYSPIHSIQALHVLSLLLASTRIAYKTLIINDCENMLITLNTLKSPANIYIHFTVKGRSLISVCTQFCNYVVKESGITLERVPVTGAFVSGNFSQSSRGTNAPEASTVRG